MPVSIRCSNPECGRTWEVSGPAPTAPTVCPFCQKLLASETPALEGTLPHSGKPHSATFEQKAPAEIGRYQVRERLGHGGFGSVYRAYDPRLEREVALKIPHPGTLATEQGKARFLREAKAAAK